MLDNECIFDTLADKPLNIMLFPSHKYVQGIHNLNLKWYYSSDIDDNVDGLKPNKK